MREKAWEVFHIQPLAVSRPRPSFSPGRRVRLHPSFKPGRTNLSSKRISPILPRHGTRGEAQGSRNHRPRRLRDMIICSWIPRSGRPSTSALPSSSSDACATKDLSYGGKSVRAEEVRTAYLAALSGTFARLTAAEELIRRRETRRASRRPRTGRSRSCSPRRRGGRDGRQGSPEDMTSLGCFT
jgi:hypothetical protein